MIDDLPRRKPLRLPAYDYSRGGCYFLTICTREQKCVLGRVTRHAGSSCPTEGRGDASVGRDDPGTPEVQLSRFGVLAQAHIRQIPDHYPGVDVEHFVVMPNHVHLLLLVEGTERSGPPDDRATQLIPRIVAAFKRLTNREAGRPLWQTSYYDHVVRNDADYRRIWTYIDNNPAQWAEDKYYME